MIFALIIAATEASHEDLLTHVPTATAVVTLVGIFVGLIKWLENRHDKRVEYLHGIIAAKEKEHVEYMGNEPKRAARAIARFAKEIGLNMPKDRGGA
jgi:hypothetical protein